MKPKRAVSTAFQYRRRACQVCQHEQRGRIDFLLISLGGTKGGGRRQLAEKFDVSESSLQRHRTHHISDEYIAAVKLGPFESEAGLRKLIAENGQSVLENMRAIYSGHLARWLTCQLGNNDSGMLAHGNLMKDLLSKMGLLTKELAPPGSHTQITNILMTPDYYRFQRRAVSVLRRHPEALADWLNEFRDEPEPIKMLEVAPLAVGS